MTELLDVCLLSGFSNTTFSATGLRHSALELATPLHPCPPARLRPTLALLATSQDLPSAAERDFPHLDVRAPTLVVDIERERASGVVHLCGGERHARFEILGNKGRCTKADSLLPEGFLSHPRECELRAVELCRHAPHLSGQQEWVRAKERIS
ncbi:hypothetical protein T492DRAFT_974348, partial [Pavlovales sp. CCMP2436]